MMVLVLVCGFSFGVVYANLFVLNYANSSVSVEEGMTIYKYQDELEQVLEDKVDFDGEVYSSGQFEVGKDDLVAVDDTDDYLTLNHYGDNAPETSLVDWWDDDSDSSTKYNWRYRRCFTVDHTGAGSIDLEEYQVLFELDSASLISAGKMLSDGDDIRFVDESGVLLGHYVVHGLNTNNTQIWVQLEDILSGQNQEVCMYYGYVGVGSPTNLSDAESVFTYTSQKALYYPVSERALGNNANIGSYISGTNSNQVNFGAYSNNFDQYEVVDNINIPSQSTPILAEGALSVSFDNNATDSAVPISYAGTKFIDEASRNTDTFSFVAPFGAATVNIEEASGGSFVAACGGLPLSVTSGGSATITCDITNNRAYRITSNVPILAIHGTTTRSDGYVLYPSDKAFQTQTGKYELWGVGSNSVRIASDTTCSATVHRSNNATPVAVTFNAANNFRTSISGGGTQGTSARFKVVSDCPIGAHSLADSDGTEASTFLPPKEFSHEFLITQATQYVTGAARSQSLSCRMYNSSGALLETDVSTNGDGVNRPSEIYFPISNSTADIVRYNDGFRMECDEPVFAYFEHLLTGLLDILLGGASDDETNFLSWPQGRQRALVEPILEPYSSTQEEGLYFSSGFGDGFGSVVDLSPILWVDASNLKGTGELVANGTSVDTWVDLSFRENDLESVIGRGVPIKVLDAGKETVEFTTDSLESVKNLFVNYPANDVTWFMISRTRQVTAGFAFVTTSGAGRFGTHIPWIDNIWYSDFDCCGNGRIQTGWGGNTADYFLWNSRHSTTNGKTLRRDGATIATSAVNATGSNVAIPITVGSNEFNGEHQQINISEFIIFDKNLETDEIVAVENYLRDKWGVATSGLDIDDKAFMEGFVDATSLQNSEHTFWDKIEWEEIVSDRTSQNGVDSVLVEIGYADAVPSCAAASYTNVILNEEVISSSFDTSPLYSDETTLRKYIKLPEWISDHECLKFKVYLQTGDEAYTPKLNRINVFYREAELMEDQLSNPFVSIHGNDGVDYGDDPVRILKISNQNTGLDNSTCELFYAGASNSAVFSNFDLNFMDLSSGGYEETLQFDFPVFPVVPPEVGSGNNVVCDSTHEVGLYLEHVRSAGGLEDFDLALKQDIGGFMGPLNERRFKLRVASP